MKLYAKLKACLKQVLQKIHRLLDAILTDYSMQYLFCARVLEIL